MFWGISLGLLVISSLKLLHFDHISGQVALVWILPYIGLEFLTQSMWAEVEFQIVLRDLTTILDFHSVWYGDDFVIREQNWR